MLHRVQKQKENKKKTKHNTEPLGIPETLHGMVRQQIVLTSRFPPIRAQVFNKNDTYVFIRIGAYLHYMEPEGEKPSALYQNGPGGRGGGK